jgi:hypothetical protein
MQILIDVRPEELEVIAWQSQRLRKYQWCEDGETDIVAVADSRHTVVEGCNHGYRDLILAWKAITDRAFGPDSLQNPIKRK